MAKGEGLVILIGKKRGKSREESGATKPVPALKIKLNGFGKCSELCFEQSFAESVSIQIAAIVCSRNLEFKCRSKIHLHLKLMSA
ncbi:MAG: hypothetical protein ACRYFR_18480 [Janthinobacterium lividum]